MVPRLWLVCIGGWVPICAPNVPPPVTQAVVICGLTAMLCLSKRETGSSLPLVSGRLVAWAISKSTAEAGSASALVSDDPSLSTRTSRLAAEGQLSEQPPGATVHENGCVGAIWSLTGCWMQVMPTYTPRLPTSSVECGTAP